METKRIVASAVALTMSLSMLSSGCSIINPAGGNPEVKEAAETYIAKLLKGKNTASYVDANDVKDLDITDDQWDALLAVTDIAEYSVTEFEGSKKEGRGTATIELKYVDAEDIAAKLGDTDIDTLLDEIYEAKNNENQKIILDLVFVDDEWLITLDSDEDAKDLLKNLVDDIDLGSAPVETEPSEATEEPAHTEASLTEPSETEPSETEPSETEPSETESSETTPSETDPSETSASDNTGAKIVNFDEMNFYINGKKYTLGKVTLQDLIDDGVPFDEDDIKNATNNLNKNYQAYFSVDLGDYQSASIYVLNDSDKDMPANECMVNEIYVPLYKDRTQNILKLDFPFDITPDQIKENSGKPDDENTYDSDDGTYHSYTIKYKKKSKRYIRGSSYSFEFINDELRYIYIEYIP